MWSRRESAREEVGGLARVFEEEDCYLDFQEDSMVVYTTRSRSRRDRVWGDDSLS